jgi:hypothetical protein
MANTITTKTLELVSGTTYRIRNLVHASGIIYLIRYVKGNSTSIVLSFAESYGITGIDKNTRYQVVEPDTNKWLTPSTKNINASGDYEIPITISKRTQYSYVTITFNSGTTGAVTIDAADDIF